MPRLIRQDIGQQFILTFQVAAMTFAARFTRLALTKIFAALRIQDIKEERFCLFDNQSHMMLLMTVSSRNR
ncbi:hypothetical protein Pla52o_16860 [Novipirellula galeiformis]|uniref:Uncharacterized protein n=1 Tax=Novipirellula galeiformis TaxID=2528004 RepID=A0A5C6CMS5_9BACT|nr:hypothetical protein Pla52o_16860 [Novipirellula galeiformis]